MKEFQKSIDELEEEKEQSNKKITELNKKLSELKS